MRLNKKEVQLRQMNKMNFEKQQNKAMMANIEGKNMMKRMKKGEK